MSTLDDLNDRDPLELTSGDVDNIIVDIRKRRARLAKGEKIDKPKAAALADILGSLIPAPNSAPAAPANFKRRV